MTSILIYVIIGIVVLVVITAIVLWAILSHVSSPVLSYNNDWIFYIKNNNSNDYNVLLQFNIAGSSTQTFATRINAPGNKEIIYNLFEQQQKFGYENPYLLKATFEKSDNSFVGETSTLLFTTPQLDQILNSLSTNQESYLIAKMGDFIQINESEYNSLLENVSGTTNKENTDISGTEQITILGNRDITQVSNSFAIDPGNYLYAFKFDTSPDFTPDNNVEYDIQFVYVPYYDGEPVNESGIPKPNNLYYNVKLNTVLSPSTTYYFVLKGSNISPMVKSLINIWSYPNALPISIKNGSQNVNLTSDLTDAYQNSNVQNFTTIYTDEASVMFSFLESYMAKWIK